MDVVCVCVCVCVAQESSKATWGDVLDRARKVERIRSVTNLLNRFNNLFGMPGRIKVRARVCACVCVCIARCMSPCYAGFKGRCDET